MNISSAVESFFNNNQVCVCVCVCVRLPGSGVAVCVRLPAKYVLVYLVLQRRSAACVCAAAFSCQY